MKLTQSLPEKDASPVDKSINQDDSQCIVKAAMDLERSTALKWYAEDPRPVWSMLLRKKTSRSKYQASKQ